MKVKVRNLINMERSYSTYCICSGWVSDILRHGSDRVVGVFDISENSKLKNSDWFFWLRNWPSGDIGDGDAIVVVAESYPTSIRLRQLVFAPENPDSYNLELMIYTVEIPVLKIHLGCSGSLWWNGMARIPHLGGDESGVFVGHVLSWIEESSLVTGPLRPWAERIGNEKWAGFFVELNVGMRTFWMSENPYLLMSRVAHMIRPGNFSIKKAPKGWLEREVWAQGYLATNAIVEDL